EPVSIGKFTPLGIAIRVSCPCSHEFNVMLEKRRSYRKLVELEGYFSLSGDVGPDATGNSIWGPMIIQDLSKTGLQFSSSRANLLQPGNLLLLRFNLDNENKALIHKQARVISIEGNDVRCQFEGADSYDITLGFYFM
ncbi:MAG: PilZ domain-containing protein, partial [Deltaproteobacteria bacterium]|nr:PilZ domain-containing protein [Deltaproteobacteria bacterium]